MLALVLYLFVTLIAVAWVAVDNNAVAAFEIFKRRLHSTARHLGMYWEWLVQQLLRATLLLSCVIVGIVAATWMQLQNPWNLGSLGRNSLFVTMLTCSIALLAMPHLSAYLRLKYFLNYKAVELTELVSQLSTSDGLRQHLEPAEKGAFGGVDGWTAWHPRQEGWNEEPLWAGLIPIVYLYQHAEISLIIPVDFEHFLAWKLPAGTVTPGKLMPIWPRCTVKAVSCLRGHEGWSIVHTDIELDDAAA